MYTASRPVIGTVLLLSVAGGAYGIVSHGRGSSAEVTYETGAVERGDVRSFVTATGAITPPKVIDVKSDVAGKVMHLYVDLGSHLRKGQLVADIDPTDSRTALDQANADLAAAEAKKTQADSAWSQEELQSDARIKSAQHALESNLAKVAEARADMEVQPSLTRAQVNQATANLLAARKDVMQSRNSKGELEEELNTLQVVTIPLNLKTVESSLEQSEANLATLKSDYDRQRQLMAQGYVAKSDVEQAYARWATMKANVDAARQRETTMREEDELAIGQMRAKIDEGQAAVEAAEAREGAVKAALDLARQNGVQDEVKRDEHGAAVAAVAQSRADLKSAEAQARQIKQRHEDVLAALAQIRRDKAAQVQALTNLGYCQVRAPGDGVVITKSVEEGTVVPSSKSSVGSTNALIQIGVTDALWAVCEVDETDIGQVRRGQKVMVKLDAYPSMLVDGKVIRIDPQAKLDQNVTFIPVTVLIKQTDRRFEPGMNATCEFIVDEADNVLTVPNEAVKETDGGYQVQRMVKGKPAAVPVKVGLAGQDTTEIKSGALKAGDEVVTKTIEPERSQTINPFGNPFARPQPRSGGSGRAGGR